MWRAEQRVRWPLALAATLGSSGGWTLWLAISAPSTLVVAIALQALGAALTATAVARHRELSVALALAMPGLGPLVAVLAATVRGRGGFALVREPAPCATRIDGIEIAHSLSGALPRCDAANSADPDTRRAALGTLSQRATTEDIAALRWVRAHGTSETALDAALALEQIAEQFEHRATAAGAAAQLHPGYATAAAAFRVIASGIETGIVDAASTARLVAIARAQHAAAIAADPSHASELLAQRARLEIATGHPEVALTLLRPALGADDELTALYKQAAFAARRFDLAPEVAPARRKAADARS